MTLTPLLSVTYSFISLLGCLVLGKVLNHYLGGLPASLYGLIIFTTFLQINIIKSSVLKATIEWVIRHMGVCFVPAGVGIVDQFELIRNHGLAMVAIIFVTTFALLTFVGLSYQK